MFEDKYLSLFIYNFIIILINIEYTGKYEVYRYKEYTIIYSIPCIYTFYYFGDLVRQLQFYYYEYNKLYPCRSVHSLCKQLNIIRLYEQFYVQPVCLNLSVYVLLFSFQNHWLIITFNKYVLNYIDAACDDRVIFCNYIKNCYFVCSLYIFMLL